MPKTITQRISLDGGNEFRAGLKSLGDAGQEAFQNIQNAAQGASTITSRMAPIVDALQKKMADLRVAGQNVATHFTAAGTAFKTAGTRLAELGAVVLGVQGGFAAMVLKAGEAADAINRGAAAAGLSVTEFQSMSDTFAVLGVGSDQFTTLFNKMNKTFGANVTATKEMQKTQTDLTRDFAAGKISAESYNDQMTKLQLNAKENINVFNRLGVTAELAANNPREAFLQLIDSFSKMPAGIEKSSLELDIFGRKGTQLAVIADQGRAAFEKMEKQIEAVAPPLTKAQILVGVNLSQSFRTLQTAVSNLSNNFFLLFGPTTTKLFDAITQAIVNNRAAILAFGSAIVEAFTPLTETVIQFVKSFQFDPEGTKQALLSVIEDVKSGIIILIEIWNGFVAVLDQVANLINNIFGTQITGRALAIAAIVLTVTGVFGALFAAVTAVVSVVGLLAAIFGGVEVAIVAVGVAVGFIFGKLIINLINALPAFFQSVGDKISSIWGAITGAFQTAWLAVIDFVSQKFTEFGTFVMGILKPIIDTVKAVIAALTGVGATGQTAGPDQAFAEGGQVRGPGTSRSDSIRAWLSNGEFVVKADAVQHYGSALFAALNNMRLALPNLGNVGNVLPKSHFAGGGLVSAPASAPSGRPIILQLGSDSFPMMAGQDTVNKLERYAAGKQLRSTGRKPSWKNS